MAEKTLDDRIAEIKQLQSDIKAVTEESNSAAAKINELKSELKHLKNRTDALEKIQNNASSLILTGKLSADEFSENKKSLSGLYRELVDIEDLLGIYEKALDSDYPKRHAELDRILDGRKQHVYLLIAGNLAADIAAKAGPEVKNLLAILSYYGGRHIGYNVFIDLGLKIGGAVCGISPLGHPLDLPAAEKNRLAKAISDKMGI